MFNKERSNETVSGDSGFNALTAACEGPAALIECEDTEELNEKAAAEAGILSTCPINLGNIMLTKNNWSISLDCKYCGQQFDRVTCFITHAKTHLLTVEDNDMAQLLQNVKSMDDDPLLIRTADAEHRALIEELDCFSSNDTSMNIELKDSIQAIDDLVADFFKTDVCRQSANECFTNLNKFENNNDTYNSYGNDDILTDDTKSILKTSDNLTKSISQSCLDDYPADKGTINDACISSDIVENECDEYDDIEYLLEYEEEVLQWMKGVPSVLQAPQSTTTSVYKDAGNVINEHALQLNGKFRCETCGETFSGKRGLLAHHKRHVAKKVLRCNYCNSTFLDSSNLRMHINRHLGIKAFKCEYCFKQFVSPSELKLHKRSHTGERPFKCTECHRAFINSSHLHVHMRHHSNERPFACEQCGRRFFERRFLRDHQVTHTGERRFKCDICKSKFSRRRSLVQHVNTVHANLDLNNLYTCNICTESFSYSADLTHHFCRNDGEDGIQFCDVVLSYAIELPQQQQKQNAVQKLRAHNTNQLYDSAFAVEQSSLKRVRRHESYDKIDHKFLHTLVDDDATLYENESTAVRPTAIAEASATTAADKNTRIRRQVSDWLIAPNTRWCGRGNSANGTYNHLGGASSADKCCRKHDHCKLFIPAMSNRFELFNYRPYTLSHCTCDRRFRTCLKMANDEDSNTIGKLFFNMVQTQCFILKQEHMCQARKTDGSGDCLREIVRHKAYLKNNKKF